MMMTVVVLYLLSSLNMISISLQSRPKHSSFFSTSGRNLLTATWSIHGFILLSVWIKQAVQYKE